VNKQAFYNQFWLSGALVAVSLAALQPSGRAPGPTGQGTLRGQSADRARVRR